MPVFHEARKIKGYAVRLLDAFYVAWVASVLAFCALLFITMIFAMAIAIKAINVRPLQPPP